MFMSLTVCEDGGESYRLMPYIESEYAALASGMVDDDDDSKYDDDDDDDDEEKECVGESESAGRRKRGTSGWCEVRCEEGELTAGSESDDDDEESEVCDAICDVSVVMIACMSPSNVKENDEPMPHTK